MAHSRRTVSDPSRVLALALGLCVAPSAALAAPDDEDELAVDDEPAEDDLDEDAPVDDEDAPGASGSASAKRDAENIVLSPPAPPPRRTPSASRSSESVRESRVPAPR